MVEKIDTHPSSNRKSFSASALLEKLCGFADKIIPEREIADPDRPMKTTFLIHLTLYALCALVISVIIASVFETRTCLKDVQNKIVTKFVEAKEHTKNAKDTYDKLVEISVEQATVRARFIAELIKNDPEILKNANLDPPNSSLQKIAEDLDIHEIDIVGENGIITESYPLSSLGFEYAKHPYAKEFLAILKDPTLEITQEIRESEVGNGEYYQYTAVARKDAKGFIEIGVDGEELKRLYDESANFNLFVDNRVGNDGFIAIYQNNQLKVGPELSLDPNEIELNEITFKIINDRSYFLYAEKDDNFLFLGGIPFSEVSKERRLRVALMVFVIFLVFLSIFLLVSAFVQRLFVDSVNSINNSLDKITRGDLSERVNVNSTKEFFELSEGVNATVDSLKDAANEIERKVKEEMDLAQRIQFAMLPNLDELFSNQDSFDVYAELHPRSSIGGDMYDFFFLDDDRILFYVGDVSGSGVPAALIAMKTMALVKHLALSQYDLEKVVSTTNQYLSDGVDDRFVSAFFCLLDLKSGKLEYINAGHPFPFIRRGEKDFILLETPRNLIMGSDRNYRYKSSTLYIQPNDALSLYTDGFKQATGLHIDDHLKIDDFIKMFDNIPRNASSKIYVDAIVAAVERISESPTPPDDETILFFRLLKLNGQSNANS